MQGMLNNKEVDLPSLKEAWKIPAGMKLVMGDYGRDKKYCFDKVWLSWKPHSVGKAHVWNCELSRTSMEEQKRYVARQEEYQEIVIAQRRDRRCKKDTRIQGKHLLILETWKYHPGKHGQWTDDIMDLDWKGILGCVQNVGAECAREIVTERKEDRISW